MTRSRRREPGRDDGDAFPDAVLLRPGLPATYHAAARCAARARRLLDQAQRPEVNVAAERSDEQPDDMERAMPWRAGVRRELLLIRTALRPW
jgi:hypothetical protein